MVAAIRAAPKIALVTVVEDSEVGKTCLNGGRIPTKTLIASAEALEHVRRAADFVSTRPSISATISLRSAGERTRWSPRLAVLEDSSEPLPSIRVTAGAFE